MYVCIYSGVGVAQSLQCLTMDWTTRVRSPTEAEDFSSSPCVQTGSEAHPASCTMGTGVLSPGVKRGRDLMLTTQPRLEPRLRISRSYTSSPPGAFMACSGTALPYIYFFSIHFSFHPCLLLVPPSPFFFA
jgi:hypothetical protein